MAFESITQDLSGTHAFLRPFFYWINLMITLISGIFLSREEFFWKYLAFVHQIKEDAQDFVTSEHIVP